MKMNKMISSVALLAIAGNVAMAGGDIAPVEPAVPEVVVSDGWEYSASLNLFMAGISGTTADGGDIDIGFDDILDNLDFTFMGTFGAQKGKWGFLTDFIYLNISEDVRIRIPDEPVLITNVEMKSWIVTPMVTYRVMEEEQLTLDVAAGVRYLYIKVPLEYTVPAYLPNGRASKSGDVWDGIVGLRGQYKIDEKWYMPFHFDVGAGDSDLTWQAFAGVGYKYESFDVIAGYRYLDWDMDDGEALTDLTVDGPIVGFKWHF